MTDRALALRVDDLDTVTLGQMLAKSGYFQDARDVAQCVVKVLAGRELGIGPIASMTGVNIIKGRPALSAGLLGGVLKRSGRYNYRVKELTDKAAEIEFFERLDGKWDSIGASRFTIEDARRAGTQNLEKFPRNMLFARAMTNGIRWYAPDVFAGGVYTPEELGAPVDGEGNVVQAQVIERAADPEPEPLKAHVGPDFDTPTTTEQPAPVIEAPATTAPAPENGKPAQKFAELKGKIPEWQNACKELVTRFPHYQTVMKGGQPSGYPNYTHILGAALAEGFPQITPENYQAVIEAVARRAAAKQASTASEPM